MPKKGRRKRARRMSHPRSKPKYNWNQVAKTLRAKSIRNLLTRVNRTTSGTHSSILSPMIMISLRILSRSPILSTNFTEPKKRRKLRLLSATCKSLLRIIQSRKRKMKMNRKTARSQSSRSKKCCKESIHLMSRWVMMNRKRTQRQNRSQNHQKNHNTKSSQEKDKKKRKMLIQVMKRNRLAKLT